MSFASYQGATRCTGAAAPGARALMAYILAGTSGARNLGIYNCRSVRGGSTTSLHGEGRAIDVGMPMSRGRGSAAGHRLVELLRKDADKLGIQCIIYDRKIWSARSEGGRRYNGVHPHYDHLHIELNKTGAARLNLATLRAVLDGAKPKPAPSKGQQASDEHPLGERILNEGDRGTDVAFVQRFIGRQRCGPDDGIFGELTADGVRWYQKLRGIKTDAIVGPVTWSHLLSK